MMPQMMPLEYNLLIFFQYFLFSRFIKIIFFFIMHYYNISKWDKIIISKKFVFNNDYQNWFRFRYTRLERKPFKNIYKMHTRNWVMEWKMSLLEKQKKVFLIYK